MFRRTWNKNALSCFHEVKEEFKDVISDLVQEQFSRYSNLAAVIKCVIIMAYLTRNLPILHRSAIVELMDSCGNTTKQQLQTVLELENVPFTLNTHYFQECRDKWLSKYKDARAGKGPAERVTPAAPLTGESRAFFLPSFEASSTQRSY